MESDTQHQRVLKVLKWVPAQASHSVVMEVIHAKDFTCAAPQVRMHSMVHTGDPPGLNMLSMNHVICKEGNT